MARWLLLSVDLPQSAGEVGGRDAGIAMHYLNLAVESHTSERAHTFVHNTCETKKVFAGRPAGRTAVTTEEGFVMLGAFFIEMQPISPSNVDPSARSIL